MTAAQIEVLILIVVDNGLVHDDGVGHIRLPIEAVLILIVVDNGLVPMNQFLHFINEVVLILIVVDNGLVHNNEKWNFFLDTRS